jgi:hypothetical protein
MNTHSEPIPNGKPEHCAPIARLLSISPMVDLRIDFWSGEFVFAVYQAFLDLAASKRTSVDFFSMFPSMSVRPSGLRLELRLAPVGRHASRLVAQDLASGPSVLWSGTSEDWQDHADRIARLLSSGVGHVYLDDQCTISFGE